MMPQQHRHLAAILFTDIVGYTHMMQEEEKYAVEVSLHYRSGLKKSVSAHHGEILNDYGDGSLCTFSSAFDALNAAIELQQQLRITPVVPLRIGLHIGEIFFEDGKVYGGGVNVASRIQSLGIGNSILISSAFHNNIKNHTEFKTVSIGQFHFKNVDEPMEVFALANPGLVVPKPNEIHGKLKDIPQKAGRLRRITVFSIVAILVSIAWYFSSHKNAQKTTESSENLNVRSIAVLPFDDYSPKKDQAWFTDGMTDALITELSKISSLIVRSHTSVMQYKGTTKTVPQIANELNVDAVIEGSALKAGDSVRITAQLINSHDKHLWANDYDAGMEDVLRLHHHLAQAIAKGINLVLSPADMARFTNPSKVNPAALEADLKGESILGYFETLNDLNNAIVYFQQAVKLDTTFAKAYANLATAYWFYPFFGEKSPKDAWLLAEGPNRKALQLDPQSAIAYINQFNYLYYIKWDWDGAFRALSMAETLEPNNEPILHWLNQYYITSGKFGKAFETCEKIKHANPSDTFNYLWHIGFTQFHSRDIDGSLRTIDSALNLFPDNIGFLELKSWSLNVAGKHEEAVYTCHKILSLLTGPSIIDHEFAGWIFAAAGLKSEAMNEFRILKASKYCDPVALGLIYAGLGDKDEAMKYYQQAFREHSHWLPFAKRSPAFDAMRGDPRFEKLIQDLKFP